MDGAYSTRRKDEICTLSSSPNCPEGKRLLERPRHRYVNNIKKNIKEIGYECVNWMHLAQIRTSGEIFGHVNANSCPMEENVLIT
jgi:hypothetical protein